MARGFQKVIRIEPLGVHGRVFEIVGGFERIFLLMSFGIGKKPAQNSKFRDFDKQIDSDGLVWSGSAGEAACQERERVGFEN